MSPVEIKKWIKPENCPERVPAMNCSSAIAQSTGECGGTNLAQWQYLRDGAASSTIFRKACVPLNDMCSMLEVLTGQIQGYGYLKEVVRGFILVYSVPGWGNNVH